MLDQLRLPHPGVIQVDGQTIQLPYRPKDCVLSRGEKIDDEQLQRIAASLSVRGHFSFRAKSGYPVINCSESSDLSESLLELVHLFGGRINPETNTMPVMWNPAFRWVLWGQDAFRAASILATVPSPRQKLFACFAESQHLSWDQRSNLSLRDVANPDNLEMNSWAGIGGLFDARGCIGKVHSNSKSLRIRLYSRNRSTIDGLVSFLQSENMDPGDVQEYYHSRKNRNYFQWTLNGTDRCRQFLKSVSPYLCHRKSYVSHILGLCPEFKDWNHLTEFKGNQRYFLRHDAFAAQYAQQIALLRNRAASFARKKHFSPSTGPAATREIFEQIDGLQSSLNSYMLQLNVRRSKTLIRDALSRGAFVKPPTRSVRASA